MCYHTCPWVYSWWSIQKMRIITCGARIRLFESMSCRLASLFACSVAHYKLLWLLACIPICLVVSANTARLHCMCYHTCRWVHSWWYIKQKRNITCGACRLAFTGLNALSACQPSARSLARYKLYLLACIPICLVVSANTSRLHFMCYHTCRWVHSWWCIQQKRNITCGASVSAVTGLNCRLASL
jgi:hypothetical protein